MSKEKLLDLKTNELLEKFGAGSHKPGSGSAAAFQAILSAKLIHTVILLTTEEKRSDIYGKYFIQLQIYDKTIVEVLTPQLESFFEKDSVHFGEVINLREARNKEKNLASKSDHQINHLIKLKTASEIPIQIAKLSKELAEIANYVFKVGFQAARGDALVALNGAISSMAGCISIVDLNLLSFYNDEWTENIRLELDKLRKDYNSLHIVGVNNSKSLQDEVINKNVCFKEVNNLINKIKSKTKFSDFEIEQYAVEFQRIIWKNRNSIWKTDISNPLAILRPDELLKKALGYDCYRMNNSTESEEVAGIINQEKKFVYISTNFPIETQNFTAAHELGHALFHRQTILHRDKPLDGSTKSKNSEEYQADKFATYFLMPERQIRTMFVKLFGTEKFVINQDNAFQLIQSNPSDLKKQCKNLRGLSRKLASHQFALAELNPLHKLFGVSIEAMAIRLEELNLVEF